jgi:hypothetical protein
MGIMRLVGRSLWGFVWGRDGGEKGGCDGIVRGRVWRLGMANMAYMGFKV